MIARYLGTVRVSSAIEGIHRLAHKQTGRNVSTGDTKHDRIPGIGAHRIKCVRVGALVQATDPLCELASLSVAHRLALERQDGSVGDSCRKGSHWLLR